MSRLARFEHYRFIGTRDSMVVYDCDDDDQFDRLRNRVDDEDLIAARRVQSFSPDTIEEAMNRGFSPAS